VVHICKKEIVSNVKVESYRNRNSKVGIEAAMSRYYILEQQYIAQCHTAYCAPKVSMDLKGARSKGASKRES
jgi:hypothetical protein